MNLPIVLTPEGPVPLYLQIKYQISYLITSGQLAAGDKLPPVRTVASSLEVNPGTVAQAYRELHQEGLLEAAAGRGTFVAPTIPLSQDTAVRQREATRAIDGALDRLRALGLTDVDIRLRFEAVLAAKPVERQVLLASPTEAVGLKYLAALSRRLGPSVKLQPVTYADLERGAPHVGPLLDLCYFVVTFASSVRRIEVALEAFGRPYRVLGMATELLPTSVAELGRLRPGSRALILSEERYAHQSLGLVLKHSPLLPADVELVTLEDATAGQAREGRLLIHTFGARELAEGLAPPGDRLELRFDVVEDSITRIRNVLLPA